MSAYKLYRRHNCTRRHGTYHVAAKCIWPRAVWIIGEGRFALLAWCRVLTVTLHDNPTSAEEAKALIDHTACGGMCSRRHEIVEITDTARGHEHGESR